MKLLKHCKDIVTSEMGFKDLADFNEIGSVQTFKQLSDVYLRKYGDIDGFIVLLDRARQAEITAHKMDEHYFGGGGAAV